MAMLVTAQASGIEWQKSLDGTTLEKDNFVQLASDESYIVDGIKVAPVFRTRTPNFRI